MPATVTFIKVRCSISVLNLIQDYFGIARRALWALLFCIACGSIVQLKAQNNNQYWHGIERTMHYQPLGNDFILVNGHRKFNRALYGTNTAFRVETGDLPEFALYMPGMGGNCKIGFVINNKSKWITECNSIKTLYHQGCILYEVKDSLLNKGSINIAVIASATAEGMIIKLSTKNLNTKIELVVVYGGASGKKFSRDGDIGADPESSFYLQPNYCKDNVYNINKNSFQLQYGFTKPLTDDERYEIQYKPTAAKVSKDMGKQLVGIFPLNASLQISDALQQQSPLTLLASSQKNTQPLIAAKFILANSDSAFCLIEKPETKDEIVTYNTLSKIFSDAEIARKKLADRIILQTPDEYINPMGSALALAADAIWEEPSFMHGAIAWRMRLPAWRGPYAADPLGWHDRARQHFSSYALSQVTNIPFTAPVFDTALHIARQLEKMGTAMFSNGYISRNPNGDIRPHHYDMNLVFVDELLNHFNYTGDTTYVKKMWPLLKLHLEWERKNFDADGDGLYDAYAAIWASDALQYSGGGVAHASAYNYRANKMAAELAKLIGENALPYENEANKIFTAMNEKLWLKEQGIYGEYKDLLGLQLVHASAALWTIYHTIDEGVADKLQRYQMLRYVDNNIPHIPIKANGLKDDGYYTLSTTNWQPYTWSINNVVLAENLHTALAYWQSNENENAFKLWKGNIVESMYMSAAPGNFEQLSFYDAVRGELYRDFADPIGMAARSLVEGLFGIMPDALHDQLVIRPGFPAEWKFAKLKIPDIQFDYKVNGNISNYIIAQSFNKVLNVSLQLKAKRDKINKVLVNEKIAKWHWMKDIVGEPMIEIEIGKQKKCNIKIEWAGSEFEKIKCNKFYVVDETASINFSEAVCLDVLNPQQYVSNIQHTQNSISFIPLKNTEGFHSLLVKLKQGATEWLAPIAFEVKEAVEIKQPNEENTALQLGIKNNTNNLKQGMLNVNDYSLNISIKVMDSIIINIPSTAAIMGTNQIKINWNDGTTTLKNIVNWNIQNSPKRYETININSYFNDEVAQIFNNKYLSPRPTSTAMQIPWQGIGNWCYPLAEANINDSGMRMKVVDDKLLLQQIPFATTSKLYTKNIVYTSQWDNYPKSISVPLNGKSSHAYLLMAGSTNHMQSRFTNAKILVHYKDGSTDSLLLINPTNWYPIEQDYYTDGYAFTTDAPKPYRLLLKTGEFTRTINKYTTIKGVTNKAIDGGAATVLDLPLNEKKELESLTLITIANEVVVGLMSITLVR